MTGALVLMGKGECDQRDTHVKRQQKDRHLQDKERGARTLILTSQASDCEKTNFCSLSHAV